MRTDQARDALPSLPASPRRRSASGPDARRLLALAGGLAAAGLQFGCSHDSFLYDPSVIGRWERTPTSVPILERLAPIEEAPAITVEHDVIRGEDLLPTDEVYRFEPGDIVTIRVPELETPGRVDDYQRTVSPAGEVEIPTIGPVRIAGLTETEARDELVREISRLVVDPQVSITVEQRRQFTFHLTGAVFTPGIYPIPNPEYRLLQGLIAAGGFDESVQELFVIRQTLLPRPRPASEEAGTAGRSAPGADDPAGDDLADLLDALVEGDDAPDAGSQAPEPVQPPQEQPDDSEPDGQSGSEPGSDVDPGADPESGAADTPSVPETTAGSELQFNGGEARWVFLDGSWQKVRPKTPRPAPQPEDVDDELAPVDLVSARVIRVPIEALMEGDPTVNIVIRPGDIIRVPRQDTGTVFVGGQVSRPGVFNLTRDLTLLRLIDAAGGLTQTGIPERVDLTRFTGDNRQATIMLDLRAIAEGTMPDVFIRPNDRVNVGSNFWALPMAVIRNGFRASYGFGFLLDRNFGNDVFGPPPTNNRNF